MNIKVILMDIGGVIFMNTAIENDFERMAHQFGKVIGVDPNILNDVRKDFLHDSMTGKFSNADYFHEVEKRTGKELPENIEELWVQAAAPQIIINHQLLNWVDEMRATRKVVVFSTISSLRLSLDMELGIYKHFDDKFLSTDLGITKSDPRFFTDVLKTLNTLPEEALLIDDQPKNIKRAEELGIFGLEFKAEYFYDHAAFLKAVAKFGI